MSDERDALLIDAQAWADVADLIRGFLTGETDVARPSFNATRLTHELRYSPQFARLIAAAKAEALREAADSMPLRREGQPYQYAADWLRDRAALTAEPAPTEGEGA